MVHLVVVYRHRGVIGEVSLIKHGEHGVSWLDGHEEGEEEEEKRRIKRRRRRRRRKRRRRKR